MLLNAMLYKTFPSFPHICSLCVFRFLLQSVANTAENYNVFILFLEIRIPYIYNIRCIFIFLDIISQYMYILRCFLYIYKSVADIFITYDVFYIFINQ